MKTELWQSTLAAPVSMGFVLLALKTELWQSAETVNTFITGVLLALKTELWQSNPLAFVKRRVYCSPWKLNYGKAVFPKSYITKSIARLENWTMAKLNSLFFLFCYGIARLENWTMAKHLWFSYWIVYVLLALKTELWQSILNRFNIDNMYCSPWKLNYGKAAWSRRRKVKGIARLENWTMAKPIMFWPLRIRGIKGFAAFVFFSKNDIIIAKGGRWVVV